MNPVARSIVYLTNESPFYMRMAATSLEMLRHHNRTVKVRLYLVTDGQSETISRPNMSATNFTVAALKANCEKLDIEVRPILPGVYPGDEGYFYVQRNLLKDVPEESVMYLDGDTFIFGDVEALFDRYTADLSACENEWAYGEGYQEDWLSLKPFNSGVMIWNNGWFQKWAAELPALCDGIKNGNGKIGKWLWKRDGKCLGREEFSVSVFAAREKLSYRYLDPKDCWLNKHEGDYMRAGQSVIFHSYTNHWKKVLGHVTGRGRPKVFKYAKAKAQVETDGNG